MHPCDAQTAATKRLMRFASLNASYARQTIPGVSIRIGRAVPAGARAALLWVVVALMRFAALNASYACQTILGV